MVASAYSVDEQQPGLWVYLEHGAGSLEPISLELLSKGRQLADLAGWPLTGLLIGHEIGPLAGQAFSYGADEVVQVEHPLLSEFTIEGHTHAACEAIVHSKPSVLLLGATHNGRDLAGRLAVRLRTGLNADCTDLRLDSGLLISEVSGFGGGVLAMLAMRAHRPQMATVRRGVFRPAEPMAGREGRIVRIPIALADGMIRTRVIERVVGESLDLTQAPLLVIGGRGVEGRFDLMRELADVLGGEVGATRPPVDDGYVERERQIGQTGVVCRPRVAIVCGASGAFHFTLGIQDADLVIAVNSDPQAPIFEAADYGIVGNLFEVVPAVVAALRAEREVAHA